MASKTYCRTHPVPWQGQILQIDGPVYKLLAEESRRYEKQQGLSYPHPSLTKESTLQRLLGPFSSILKHPVTGPIVSVLLAKTVFHTCYFHGRDDQPWVDPKLLEAVRAE
jgi:hypothetical protein